MYVKRKLGIKDLMPAVRIVGKIGVADFKKCFSVNDIKESIKKLGAEGNQETEEQQEKLVEKVGFETALNAVDVLLQNIPKCENELYSFLASMCEVPVEEFLAFPPSAFVDVLQEIFTAEEAKDFFSHVSRLLNLEKSTSGTSSTEDTKDQTT